MKRRFLFIVTNMGTGGIMRSLQNILTHYDTERFEVDVFAMTHQGAFCKELPYCTILPRNRILDASIGRYELQRGFAKLESLFVKSLNKVTRYRFQRHLFHKVAKGLICKKKYDIVIGFSEGAPTMLVSMMNHANKIGWIHCDYASYQQLRGGKTELSIYEQLQRIVCVSNYTCSSFCHIYPSLANKTVCISNIVDDSTILSMAKETIQDKFDKTYFNIVSVGRIDPVKRLSIIPELAKKIVSANCKIRWYIIGPKGTREEVDLLLTNIKKCEVKDIVLLLGEKKNPYPYILDAELLVNTSISEACPYVINEAKILHTPVICTDFGSAVEFIDYGVNGFYEKIDEMAERIIWLIKNPGELSNLKTNLECFRYNNEVLLNKIYSLMP